MRKLLLHTLPLLLLIGCGSLEKKHYKAVKFFNENETLAAEYCSGKFPSQTEYIKGEEIVKIDTVPKLVPYQVDCDSLVNANKGTDKPNVFNGVVSVPCEQRTIRVTDTLKTPDLARERVLNDKINNCNADNVLLKKENEELKKELKNSKIYNWVLGGLCGIFIIILIKRR